MIPLVSLVYIYESGGERIEREVLKMPLLEFTSQDTEVVRNELQQISYGKYFFSKGLRPIGDKDYFRIGKVKYHALSVAVPDIPA